MRAFTATLGTETNSFSPITTGEKAFRDFLWYDRGRAPSDLVNPFVAPLVALRSRGWDVHQGLIAFAQPAGPLSRSLYEKLRDMLLADLAAAMPVDIVALGLHGAMIADGYDDCEGDLLARVRQVVGKHVPVGAELDPHCHLSEAMVGNANILVCFKENPHTDYLERGMELIRLLERQQTKEIEPVTSVYDCGMIDFLNTRMPAMRRIVDLASAAEGRDGVLSVSIVHGFSRGDTEDMGTKVLVVTDNARFVGDAVAQEIGRALWHIRGQARPEFIPLNDAVERVSAATGGPLVLADAADNPGGGAPSDSTFIARALLERGIDDFALALLWDPQAVEFAIAAGEGAEMPLRFGGKACHLSGTPLDLVVRVERIVMDAVQTFGTTKGPIGRAVCVRSGRSQFVLTDLRNQVFSTDVFTAFGISPQEKRALVVKSAQHFRPSFEPLAADILLVEAPGVCDLQISTMPFRKIARPKWPLSSVL